MRSTVAVQVHAPAELVFALARDVELWPALLPHYLRVRVRERHPDRAVTADMVAVRSLVPALGLGLPVAWRSRAWSERETLQLRFLHRGGATNGMQVTWRIDPIPTGCRVSIEHDFRPRLPAWGTVINRLFVRSIAMRTLATFKSIAEAVAETVTTFPAPDARSEAVPPSNTAV